MSTAEEQAKTIIRRFEQETVERIAKASEQGQADILSFVTDYIASLQIELPLSVKQVMDRGGQVRQIVIEQKVIGYPFTHISLKPMFDGMSHGGIGAVDADFPQPVKGARITMIVEPIE